MAGEETELRSATAAEGVPGATASRLAPPSSIGVIRIGKQLGQGGMASVYEGFDDGFSPPRQVAVKFMDPAISADPEFRKRFGREAAVVANFRHDNIVHVYASGEVTGIKYIVMEYLSGGSLAQRVQEGALPRADAIRVGAALADALSYSHARGIIHRDFKPGNVLLTAEGKPVLSDFGVAKNLTSEESLLTRHAIVIGAPRYMSPEQGLAEAVTDRTDIYSLGLTLFEMLTGTLPPMNLRVQRDLEQARDLALHVPDAPPRLIDLIGRCLQFAPTARPSGEECRRELEAALLDLNPPAEPPPKPRRTSFPLVAGALVAMLLAVVAYIQFGRQAAAPTVDSTAGKPQITLRRHPISTQIYLDDAEVSGTQVGVPPGLHTLVAIAPGYYGEVRRFRQADGAPGSIERFDLQPVQLPSDNDYALFLELDDAGSPAQGDIEGVNERTLRTALLSKVLWQANQQQPADELLSNLQVLAKHGDIRAPVALLLAQGMRAGNLSGSLITDELRRSSEQGDAMASFFLALAQRESLSQSAELSPSNAAYRDYCDRLAKAEAQGWRAVAREQRKNDRCPG